MCMINRVLSSTSENSKISISTYKHGGNRVESIAELACLTIAEFLFHNVCFVYVCMFT